MPKAEMPGSTGFVMSDSDFKKFEERLAYKERKKKKQHWLLCLCAVSAILGYVITCALWHIETPIPDPIQSLRDDAIRAAAIASFRADHLTLPFTLSPVTHYGIAVFWVMAAIAAVSLYFYCQED